jgi:hypothetical protein
MHAVCRSQVKNLLSTAREQWKVCNMADHYPKSHHGEKGEAAEDNAR